MATAIVSIACSEADVRVPSLILLWLAVLAFVSVAALDFVKARHPVTLVHQAGAPAQGFAAFGFVADTCVLGTRISMAGGDAARAAAIALLVAGVMVWVVIIAALSRSLETMFESSGPAVIALRARGGWLLATVATEGLAILLARLTVPSQSLLRDVAAGLWALGGVLYLGIVWLLTLRIIQRGLRPSDLTPDWWILVGGVAIFALAGASLADSVPRDVAVAAWLLAAAGIPVLIAAEGWRALALGWPRFTPERWTMVFPLGMFSAAGQTVGHVSALGWIASAGRAWLPVGLAAWLAVAAGELHFSVANDRVQ